MARIDIQHLTARPRARGRTYFMWQPPSRFKLQGFRAVALTDADGNPSTLELASEQARWMNAIFAAARAGQDDQVEAMVAQWAAGRKVLDLQPCAPIAYRWPHGTTVKSRGRHSLHELIEGYKKSQFYLDLSPRSAADYAGKLKILDKLLGPEPVKALTRGPLRRTYESLIRKHGKASANYHMRVLSVVLSYGVELEWIIGNPMHKFGYASTEREPVVPTEAHRLALMQACAQSNRPDTAALIALAAFSGNRRGDLVRLQLADYLAGEIHVTQSKRGKHVAIGVLPELAEAVDPLLAELERRYGDINKHFAAMKLRHGKGAWFRRLDGPPILWNLDTGLPMETSAASDLYAAAREIAEKSDRSVGRIMLKHFRGFANTDLYRAGATDAQTNAIIGHSEKTGDMKRKHYMERHDPVLMREGFEKWRTYRETVRTRTKQEKEA